MPEAQRFSFNQRELPYLPLRLNYQTTSLDLEALLDTGSTVNVLPYSHLAPRNVDMNALFVEQRLQSENVS